MATITTLGTSDNGSTSRTTINDNFTNLNTDKIETSVISTDGTLAGNSDTELPTEQAVKTYVDATVNTTVESTAGATHSLTTTAGQVVLVSVTGQLNTASSANETLTLKYNGVTKQTIVSDIGSTWNTQIVPFAMQYTETPGAATANITVETSAGTLSNVVIIVQIIG